MGETKLNLLKELSETRTKVIEGVDKHFELASKRRWLKKNKDLVEGGNKEVRLQRKNLEKEMNDTYKDIEVNRKKQLELEQELMKD